MQLLSALAGHLYQVVNFNTLGIGLYDEQQHVVHGYALNVNGKVIHQPSNPTPAEETLTLWLVIREMLLPRV